MTIETKETVAVSPRIVGSAISAVATGSRSSTSRARRARSRRDDRRRPTLRRRTTEQAFRNITVDARGQRRDGRRRRQDRPSYVVDCDRDKLGGRVRRRDRGARRRTSRSPRPRRGIGARYELDCDIHRDDGTVTVESRQALTVLGRWTFETIRYEADGPVATITLARPEAANAQSSQLIDEHRRRVRPRRRRRRGPGRRPRRRGQALLGRPRPQGDPRAARSTGRAMRRHARRQARARADHVLGQARARSATSARSRSPRCRARARRPG